MAPGADLLHDPKAAWSPLRPTDSDPWDGGVARALDLRGTAVCPVGGGGRRTARDVFGAADAALALITESVTQGDAGGESRNCRSALRPGWLYHQLSANLPDRCF